MITTSEKIFRKPKVAIKISDTKWVNNHKSVDRLETLPAFWGLDTGVVVTCGLSPNFSFSIKQIWGNSI